ncbi:MAG: glycosyltransferase family 2 protein [Sediminibacterium sp.]
MKNVPLVSVIIPTYKNSNTLIRAINSVISQTYENWELIIVDDNDPFSPERRNTEKNVEQYFDYKNIIYISHSSNLNASAARNTGFKFAKGELIAFLDDDDEFYPEKLEKQVLALSELDLSWGGIYCNYEIISPDKRKAYVNNHDENILENLLLVKNSICGGSTLLVRRSVYEDLKGFDVEFNRHQDWEFLVRFLKQYKLALVEDLLVNIYVTTKNPRLSKDSIESKEFFLSNFANEINSFGTRKQIYKRQWYSISLSYLRSFQLKESIYCLHKSYKSDFLSLYELSVWFFSFLKALVLNMRNL